MLSCPHVPATPSTLRLADDWLKDLYSRVSTLLDNATYTKGGCERVGAHWSGGQRCEPEVGTRLRPGQVEALQPRTGFARFDIFEPIPGACDEDELLYYRGMRAPRRRGGGVAARDDGGKWLCGLRSNTSGLVAAGAVILSLGGNNQWDFERSMVAHGPDAAIHTFDCTVKIPRIPAALRTRVTFHRTCVGAFDGHDASGRRFVTWRTLLAELGWPTVRLLKIDIEVHAERSQLAPHPSHL